MAAKTLGEAIRNARDAKGWNTEELADAAGIDKNTVNRAERNIRITPKKLAAIAHALGKRNIAEIFTAELDKPQPQPQTSPAVARPGVPTQQAHSLSQSKRSASELELAVIFLERLDTELLATLVRLSLEDQRKILYECVDPLLMRRLQEQHGQPPENQPPNPSR